MYNKVKYSMIILSIFILKLELIFMTFNLPALTSK